MSPSLHTHPFSYIRYHWRNILALGIMFGGIAFIGGTQIFYPTGFRGFMDENQIGQRLSLASIPGFNAE